MTTFSGSDDLRGARFVGTDLSGAVMRGVELDGADLDSPWLSEARFLRVNGVDVVPLVEAELDRRFPGRSGRKATDPDGLRSAWAALERTWTATLARAAALPPGTVDRSVDGEWSFAQTLRHLVFATDLWLGKAVLESEQPFHPLGLRHDESDPFELEGSTTGPPSYDDVLDARASRVAMVRDLLADVTLDELGAPRRNPHDPDHPETTLSCLHVILEEEWEHHRYAVRDLDVLAPPYGDDDDPWMPPPTGAVIRLMGDHGAIVPLWSTQDGLMFVEADELVSAFGVSPALASDLAVWGEGWERRSGLPEHDAEAAALVRRLNAELDGRYQFVYRP